MIQNLDEIKASPDISKVLQAIGYHKRSPYNTGAEKDGWKIDKKSSSMSTKATYWTLKKQNRKR